MSRGDALCDRASFKVQPWRDLVLRREANDAEPRIGQFSGNSVAPSSPGRDVFGRHPRFQRLNCLRQPTMKCGRNCPASLAGPAQEDFHLPPPGAHRSRPASPARGQPLPCDARVGNDLAAVRCPSRCSEYPPAPQERFWPVCAARPYPNSSRTPRTRLRTSGAIRGAHSEHEGGGEMKNGRFRF